MRYSRTKSPEIAQLTDPTGKGKILGLVLSHVFALINNRDGSGIELVAFHMLSLPATSLKPAGII